MGHLLDAGPGTARVEVRGSVAELAARARPTARLRIGFHEPNSPALIQQLVDALDAGAIPALAHPRWPKDVAADALRRAGADEPWQGAPIATLLFTSGSTAAPKIVAHTLDAHLTAARASKERVPYGPGDRWLLSLPLCHVGGLSLLFRTVCAGATLVLPDPEEPLAAAVARTRPT
ncbi:MAG: AMP-binding protein, partial [Planctomycetota bacterium]|nr:AMP-binding protein [Planctomycetota bacterium]